MFRAHSGYPHIPNRSNTTVVSHQIQRQRRNTVGSIKELSSSSSSSNCSESSLKQRRAKSWYGPRGFVENIRKSMFEQEDRSVKKKEKLLKRALDIIVENCPEGDLEEFLTDYIQPLKQKMKQKSVFIGICGHHDSGKKTLCNVLQHSRALANSSDISFRLCHPVNSPHVSRSLNNQLKDSLISCSAYICVISCDQLEAMDSSYLEVLLTRDKDIFNQHRALVVCNKFDTCLTATGQHLTLMSQPNPSQTSTPSTSSEYLHYERLLDCEDLEKNAKEKVKGHIQHCIGVDLPDSCIHTAILQWALVSRSHCLNVATGPEIVSLLKEWMELYKLFGEVPENETEEKLISDGTLFEEITGIKEIESWILYHIGNSGNLKELSLLSDIIYCIRFCTEKLTNEIDTAKLEIECLEAYNIQKKQLIIECNSYYRQLRLAAKDVSFFTNLMEAYDLDIKEPLLQINELVQSIMKQFKETSEKKLERLAGHLDYVSMEELLETFEIDIDTFSRGAAKRLSLILRTVKFQNMHYAVPIKDIIENCQELTKLADHLLQEQMGLEMAPSTQSEDILRARASSCIIGLEFFHPITYDAVSQDTDDIRAIASQLHQHFYSMLLHYSIPIIPNHPLQHEELKLDYKTDFRKHCEQYLLSDELKRRTVEFHMSRIDDYTSEFLAKFDCDYGATINNVKMKNERKMAILMQSKDINERKLKEVITLKVELEMQKALLLANY